LPALVLVIIKLHIVCLSRSYYLILVLCLIGSLNWILSFFAAFLFH